MPKQTLQHYGVKGMQWGVRKDRARSAAKTFLTGDPKTSLFHPEGRKNFKKDVASGKNAISKLTDEPLFKTFVFDKSNSILFKQGRDKVRKAFKDNADKRYKEALKKEKDKAAAKKKKAAETRKLIDQLIEEDKSISKFFGKSFNETSTRKYWENMFASELKEE